MQFAQACLFPALLVAASWIAIAYCHCLLIGKQLIKPSYEAVTNDFLPYWRVLCCTPPAMSNVP